MSRKTKYQRAVDEAAAFNKLHRPGTPVNCWPGVKDGPPRLSTTRGHAWALPSGEAVVKVHGCFGGLSLTHIEVIPQPAESETPTMSIDTTTEQPAVETDPSDPTVTVFSKNDCPDCTRTKERFLAKGVPFREINVQEDTEPRAEFGNKTPLEYVKERYGLRMPAVVVMHNGHADSWTGPRPDKVVETGLLFKKLDALVPVP